MRRDRATVYRSLHEAMAAKAARPDRMKAARDANRARKEARVARARELRAQDKSPARIAQIMSAELGYPEDRPLDSRQVRRWGAAEAVAHGSGPGASLPSGIRSRSGR